MRRHLALPAPAHGHPFRAQLALPKPRAPRGRSSEDSDLKLFVLSFTAFFVCFYTFLL